MADLYYSRRLEKAVAALGATLHPAQVLAGDGSDRSFFRLLGSPTVILLSHPQAPGGRVNENDSYVLIARHLRGKGVPVPEIYDYCREEGWVLAEDLGDVNLEAALKQRLQGTERRYWYRQAIKILITMQVDGKEDFDWDWCFDTPLITRTFLRERECHYFVQSFLKGYLGLAVQPEELAPDFERLVAGALPEGGGAYFLHRDYQSRNLLIKDGRLRVIDFQGGRLGPLGYDLAALLIDPYVALTAAEETEFRDMYLEMLAARQPVVRAAFLEAYYHLALCRNLQVLGAFGFLTRVKGKDYFARYIPAALETLTRRLAERPGQLPRLEKLVAGLRL